MRISVYSTNDIQTLTHRPDPCVVAVVHPLENWELLPVLPEPDDLGPRVSLGLADQARVVTFVDDDVRRSLEVVNVGRNFKKNKVYSKAKGQ